MNIISSFLITLVAIFFLRSLAPLLHLVDVPDQRKQHKGNIPLVGGIAIFAGVFFASLGMPDFLTVMKFPLLFAGLIMILGATDDACNMKPKHRLILQICIIVGLMASTGITLHHFGKILFVGNLSFSPIRHLVTIAAVCAGVNAFNMIDGIDGLAATKALIAFAGMAFLFGSAMPVPAAFCLVFCGAILAFLLINLSVPPFKKKVFLGDAGSMLLGFVIAFLLIYGSQDKAPAFRPITCVWLIGLPLMDMVGIMLRRVLRGQSPMTGDRNHLHHILLNAGLSPKKCLALMTSVGAIMALVGILGEIFRIPEGVMMVSFLLLFALYNFIERRLSQY
jgi:UDP-GlcNAc:undecaprenyl-phosphate GlcNAc-1-phosphate transferase